MRIVTIATYYVSLSNPPGKRYNRAVSIQEHKEKVLSITSVDKRVHNDLHSRDFLVFLTVNYLLVCFCLGYFVCAVAPVSCSFSRFISY